jgi:hypothetical protein
VCGKLMKNIEKMVKEKTISKNYHFERIDEA